MSTFPHGFIFFFQNKHGELIKLMAGEICSPGEGAHTAGGRWMDGDELMTSALKEKDRDSWVH